MWAVDFPPSYPDAALLEIARKESRIVLTHDRDFGELIFRNRLTSEGVILLRFDAVLQAERLARFQFHWATVRERAPRHFLVVSDLKLRIRPLP